MADTALERIKFKKGKDEKSAAQAYTSSFNVYQAFLRPTKGESSAEVEKGIVKFPNEITQTTIQEAIKGKNVVRFKNEEELFKDLGI